MLETKLVTKESHMEFSSVLGTIASGGARYLVAQSYHLRDKTALIYNAVDITVSFIARKFLEPRIYEVYPMLLASRAIGCFSATFVLIALERQIDPKIAVVMSIAGFVAGIFMELATKGPGTKPTFVI